MQYKVCLQLVCIASLLLGSFCEDREYIEEVNRGEIFQENVEEERQQLGERIEPSGTQFRPSYGPPQPPGVAPQTPAPPSSKHVQLIGNPVKHVYHSPSAGYNHKLRNGLPYAQNFPYPFKRSTLFTPSPPDLFLEEHSPVTHLGHLAPHDEMPFSFPLPIPHSEGNALLSTPHFNVHHHETLPSLPKIPPLPALPALPAHPPHPPIPHHSVAAPHTSVVPHNNPHSFHSVVNYGQINLHHGDHYEPHNNGKHEAPPTHPPPLLPAQYATGFSQGLNPLSSLPGLNDLGALGRSPYLPAEPEQTTPRPNNDDSPQVEKVVPK